MTLKLNSSGGYTSIDAHASAANNALVLPQNNGTAGQILQTDGSGNLSWVDKPSGITEIDAWRISNDTAGDNNPLTSVERVDTGNFAKKGTGMTESSGIFTFPSTGMWLVTFTGTIYGSGESNYSYLSIETTSDNGSNWVAHDWSVLVGAANTHYTSGSTQAIIDVTDKTNIKVKFRTDLSNNSAVLAGSSSQSYSYFTFIRLGDT